ncbi:endospore germination permease [Paenibacillus sp. Marseille-Q4541]|uniref:GerAB/ArcD/ProY family transporter n=1 Tax=Paenibacillus sp. Marseille-Q4541 TaxID=2831522 RepID=UPI001BA503B2|nr:endospore germination permease [Paenibacillus sp. Marseille-Q4541]
MKKVGKVEDLQYTILTTLFTVGTTILITPGGLAVELNQDAWLAPIFAIVPGLLFVVLYRMLVHLQSDRTMVEMIDFILGSWLGKIVNILIIVTAFLAAAMVLFDVSRFITTVSMPQTPVLFINVLFILLLVYGLMSGFDTLARMVEIMFPVCSLLFVLMIFSLLPQIDPKNIQPILDSPIHKYVYGTLSLISVVYMPLIFFLMIQPKELKNPKHSYKSFVIGVSLGSVVNIIIIVLNILVLGSNVTSIQEYPAYHLAQKIDISGFIDRVEAVVALMWLMTSFVKLLIYFYSAFLGFTQVFKIKHQKSFIIPLAFLLIVVSVDIFPNSVYENKFNSSVWIGWITSIAVGIPVMLLTVKTWKTWIKRK